MKLLKFFIVFIAFTSCQRRVSFNEERTVGHYETLKGIYSEYHDGSGEEIIRQYLINQLNKKGSIVDEIHFDRERENVLEDRGSNIICRFYPQMSRRIMFVGLYSPWGLAHTDRYEQESARMSFNLAFMLETARILSAGAPNQFGVDLIFLDCLSSEPGELNPSFSIFAESYDKIKPEAGIYLRLNNADEMRILIDQYSYEKVPHIVYKIWEKARLLGITEFEQKFAGSHHLRDEEILYEDFYIIKLHNKEQFGELPVRTDLNKNFIMLGSLFSEIIYDKD